MDDTPAGSPDMTIDKDLQDVALGILADRARFRAALGSYVDLFRDPAWDAMLQLFANAGNVPTPISKVCEASGLPKTTTLRLVRRLKYRGLVEWSIGSTDHRILLVRLSNAGVEMMRQVIQMRAA